MKPTITFTSISVSFIPTAKASSGRAATRAREDEDDERLLGADPAGRDRDERGQALRHLDEEDVAQALLDAERAEEEPDRDEAEHPVSGLPARDRAAVLPRSAQYGEALPTRCLNSSTWRRSPVEADHAEDRQRDDERDRELGVRDEEAEVEAGQAAAARPTPGSTPSVSA